MYYNKYLKYKQKYIKLQSAQNGGTKKNYQIILFGDVM